VPVAFSEVESIQNSGTRRLTDRQEQEVQSKPTDSLRTGSTVPELPVRPVGQPPIRSRSIPHWSTHLQFHLG